MSRLLQHYLTFVFISSPADSKTEDSSLSYSSFFFSFFCLIPYFGTFQSTLVVTLTWKDISLTGMRKIKTHNWKQECRPQIMVQVYGTLFTQLKIQLHSFHQWFLNTEIYTAGHDEAFQVFLTS